MTSAKYPGWRTMTASQRYNARMERIWQEARELEAMRVARGEQPNPNLSPCVIKDACKPEVVTA